jgi:lysophospholipase L1-like esterase
MSDRAATDGRYNNTVNRAVRWLVFRAVALLVGFVVLELLLQAGAFLMGTVKDARVGIPLDESGREVSRVLCLGESTTEGYGETPYTEHLQNRLAAAGWGRFEVINAGFVAEHTTTLVRQLEELIAQHRPDVVVAMMGVNDAFYYNQGKSSAVPPRVQSALLHLRTYRLARLIWSDTAGGAEGRRARTPYTDPRVHAEQQAFFAGFRQAYAAWEAREVDDPERPFLELIRLAREAANKVGSPQLIPEGFLFYYNNTYNTLVEIYREQSRPSASVELLEEALRRHPDNEFFLRLLAGVHTEAGETRAANKLLARADALALSRIPEVTRDNYRRALKLTNDSGALFVAMQYPLRNAGELELMLEGAGDVIVIDNDAVFREAVASRGYDALFVDRFAGDFGHCTSDGYALLADQLMDIVFEPLASRR